MVVDVVSTTKPRHVVSTSLSDGRWRRERRASSRVDASPPTAGRRAAPFSSLVGDDVDDASGRRRRATLLYTSILARLISTRAASRSMFVVNTPRLRALTQRLVARPPPPSPEGHVASVGGVTRESRLVTARHRSVVTRRASLVASRVVSVVVAAPSASVARAGGSRSVSSSRRRPRSVAPAVGGRSARSARTNERTNERTGRGRVID